MYNAIVTRIKNVRAHSNADRVKLATCQGNQVVIGLDQSEGELGVYFPCDGRLSNIFCLNNNLYRDPTMNKDKDAKPGMFDANGRVRAQRFRGEISDGFWVPLSFFDFIKSNDLNTEGFEFNTINGVEICSKYVNQETIKAAKANQPKQRKCGKSSIMFVEHIDTKQMMANIHKIEDNDHIIISDKLHGTSGRCSNVLIKRNLSRLERIAKFFGVKVHEYEWSYLNGTRRVVLEETSGKQFHDPSIREKAFNLFKDNLRKGETVYFEIVGYENPGRPIMGTVDTIKLNDKDFTKKYANAADGKGMIFKYGCADGECDVYVYRITLTNEDGQCVDYSYADVGIRCAELGVKQVPTIESFTKKEFMLRNNISTQDDFETAFMTYVNVTSDGPDVIDPTHYREGICIRLESGLTPRIFKTKNFCFKVLEQIIKSTDFVDTEEAQSEVTIEEETL